MTIGLVWFGLTVEFEFLFGHFVAEHSWTRLMQDYNLLAGHSGADRDDPVYSGGRKL